MKIVSVVGKKNTGKTSLTVKIIEELTKRGYNVASIKHSHHSMEMDKENTDTWRHKQAGSNVVVGIGSTTFFNVRKEMDLNRLLFLIKHLDDVDFVVIEGFKRYNYPKIITSPDVRDEYTIKEVNSFTINPKGIEELADMIEEKGHDIIDTLFARNCGFNNGEAIAYEIREGNLSSKDLDDVHSFLSIDENVVGLNRFVSNYLKQTILGVVTTLNLEDYNVEKISKIELMIPEEYEPPKTFNGKCRVFINNKNLEINPFTSDIIVNTIKGMINSLKTPEVKIIHIEITDISPDDLTNSKITTEINNESLEMNNFTRKILKETVYALINTLHIDENINKINIDVTE